MFRTTTVLVILLLIVGAVAAQAAPKNLTASGGVYVITSDDGEDRESFEGYCIEGTLALGPGSAARGHLYFTTHEDDEELTINGFDAQFLLGSNLNRVGFKLYALGGYFKETFEVDMGALGTAEEDFAGFMAGIGIGYNWPSASLDFWAAWRQSDEYLDYHESVTGVRPDINMGAGALTFGLRF